MAAGASEEMREGQDRAFEMLLNPQVGQMLQLEGYRPKIKELLVSILENNGSKDSEKYFEQLPEQLPEEGPGSTPGNIPGGAGGGLQGGGSAVPQAPLNQGMARPQQVQ